MVLCLLWDQLISYDLSFLCMPEAQNYYYYCTSAKSWQQNTKRWMTCIGHCQSHWVSGKQQQTKALHWRHAANKMVDSRCWCLLDLVIEEHIQCQTHMMFMMAMHSVHHAHTMLAPHWGCECGTTGVSKFSRAHMQVAARLHISDYSIIVGSI